MKKFPPLKKSDRSAEFKNYSYSEIRNTVIEYLFNGLSHRKIDEKVLKKNPLKSRGYQSMGILHYVGIIKDHKGIFNGYSFDEAVYILNSIEEYELLNILNNEIQEFSNLQADTNLTSIVKKEGKKIQFYTTKYERSPQLRERALEIHGYQCSVCNFDFENTYGEIGKGYIEIHHVMPLFSFTEEKTIDPQKDLIPICSNCHRMIHRKRNNIITVEELSRRITPKCVE